MVVVVVVGSSLSKGIASSIFLLLVLIIVMKGVMMGRKREGLHREVGLSMLLAVEWAS